MFSFSPRQRCDASTALKNGYFTDAEPKPLSATSLAVELEPLLRASGAESSSDDDVADDDGAEGGSLAGLRRGPLFGFGSGGSADSGGSAASSSGRGVLRRQPLFGSAESGGSGFGSTGGSGSSMTLGGESASGPVGGGGRVGVGGLFGSGATRALFDSGDDSDPDL